MNAYFKSIRYILKLQNRLLWLSLFFFLGGRILGQQGQIEVTINSRVDTTRQEVKEVAKLWIKYLNSTPDSLYDNPYWNNAEKRKYEKFDFSTPYMYQSPSREVLNYYRSTILSIEKEGEYYGIRTLFSADGAQGEYRRSNPWCITKLYAIKEAGEWKLKNALPIITAKWDKKTVEKISFIYPSDHKFNTDLATKANQFCNEIADKFKFPEWEPFEFYITGSGDELGKLLNFDFFFAGYTEGVGMGDNRILLSGKGSEYYPHELVHLITPKLNRHYMIDEGFATWQGGQSTKTFAESALLFANELAKNEAIKFADILNKQWGWQYGAFYTTGAILCNAAYEKGGVKMVTELLKVPNDNEKLADHLCRIFDLEKNHFEAFWRAQVLRYRTH